MFHTRHVRRSPNRAPQLLCALATMLVAACGTGGDDDGGADALRSLSRSAQVTAGGSLEANFIMQAGAKITCDFSTAGISLRWDVHKHEGGDTVLDSGVDSAGQIVFVAPDDGGFSLMWENLDMTTAQLDLSMTFDGDVQFHSWFPDN